jgi:hypothetical protein
MPATPDFYDDERATLVAVLREMVERPLFHVAPREAPAGDSGQVRRAPTTARALPVAKATGDAQRGTGAEEAPAALAGVDGGRPHV